MIAPASEQLASQFGITNGSILAMVTSVFVLGYGKKLNQLWRLMQFVIDNLSLIAFGPMVLGPLSELCGRSRVLQLANLWYLGRYLIPRSLM